MPSTSVEPEANGQEATGTESDTEKDKTIGIANGTQNENMSLIARQRELRTKRAEQEALEKQAAEAAAASEHIGMDISVATADEKARQHLEQCRSTEYSYQSEGAVHQI